MEDRFVTRWERSWVAAPALMFRRGRADTGLTGISTPPNRAIHRGVTKPFSTCIAAALRRGLEALIQTTEARTEPCTCSLRRNHIHSPSHYSKERNHWVCKAFQIRMAA